MASLSNISTSINHVGKDILSSNLEIKKKAKSSKKNSVTFFVRLAAILRFHKSVEEVLTEPEYTIGARPVSPIASEIITNIGMALSFGFSVRRLSKATKGLMKDKKKNCLGEEVDKSIVDRTAEASSAIASAATIGRVVAGVLASMHSWGVVNLSSKVQKEITAVALPLMGIALIFSTLEVILTVVKHRQEVKVWEEGLKNARADGFEKEFMKNYKRPDYGWVELSELVDRLFSLSVGLFGLKLPPAIGASMVIGLSTLSLGKAFSTKNLDPDSVADDDFGGDSIDFDELDLDV